MSVQVDETWQRNQAVGVDDVGLRRRLVDELAAVDVQVAYLAAERPSATDDVPAHHQAATSPSPDTSINPPSRR